MEQYGMDLKAGIIKQYLSGASIRSLSNTYGISYSTIHHWIEQFNKDNSIKKDINSNSAESSNTEQKENKDNSTTDIKELCIQMKNYFKSKNYPMVEKLYAKIISINPNDVHARSIFMHSLISQGKFEKEQEIYNEIMQINTNDLYAKAIHIKSLIEQGKFDEAKIIYNEAIATDPNNPHIKSAYKTTAHKKNKKYKQAQHTPKKSSLSTSKQKEEKKVDLSTESR